MRSFAWAFALLGAASAQEMQHPLVMHEKTRLSNGNPSRPLIDSEALQNLINKENLLAQAEALYNIAKRSADEYNHPTRVIGSEGHTGTLSYLISELSDLDDYYNITLQPFHAVTGNVYESRLLLGDNVADSAAPMGLTPPTADKQPVHADLALVHNEGCDKTDYPDTLRGKIALIRRGSCPFGTKSAHAGKAGAVAAVVYNTDSGGLQGTLGTPSPDHVATFGLAGSEATPVVEKLQSGVRVDAIAYIDSYVETINTTNVLAQTLEGNAENCVMLGGHSDSVTEGPGINDDGSGSLTVLEVAKQLTKFSVKNCVRFAWWAGEEEGLLGSDYYVSTLSAEENRKIRLFMDYDMMGSPNFAYQIYDARNDKNPIGSQELRDLYVDWYEAHGLNHTFIPFDGRSDYDAFIRNGIPGGGIATGAEGIKTAEEKRMFGGKAGEWYDPCYHQLCDDVANVNMTAWETNTKLVAHSVATFARSFDGFPERTGGDATSQAYGSSVQYHGPKLVV